MNNMDLTTFYQHAIQWKHQKEEAQRMAAEAQQKLIEAEWHKIADVIREALPLQGMTLHENVEGEFNEMPRKGIIYGVDCQIDPSKNEMMKQPPEDGRSMDGVIRVHVSLEAGDTEPSWKIIHYTVWVNGQSKTFDHPYEAFLAAFAELQHA